MVNTVGSFTEINKYWQKKWIGVKCSLFISEEQKAILVGSLLGDGTLRTGRRAVNANLKIEHGLNQKEYVLWKYQILKPWVFTEPKVSYRYRISGERYAKSWWFRTIRHPILTEFYKRFYVNGRKIIPADIIHDLNSLVLAIWIMDDGSFNRNKIDISTYAFNLSEINLLQRVLKSRFGLETKYYQDRKKGHRMYLDTKETQKLISIIKPHIIPTLAYKINSSNSPVTT